MSEFVLKDCKFYGGGYDLSGSLNRGKLELSTEIKDATPFGVSSIVNKAGIHKASLDFDGYYEAGSGLIDDVLDAHLETDGTVYSVFPEKAAVGDVGHSFNFIMGQLTRAGQYRELLKLNVTGEGSEPLIRQTLMELGTKSSGGNGTGRALGAVAAGQKARAVVHVLSGSGTLGVVLQSSADAGFSSPTTRATFTNFTGIGAQIAESADGPITDTYWRFVWTVSGGPFSVVMGAGIGR